MSLKKLAVATVLIGGGVAAATSTSAFDHLFSASQQEPTQEVLAHAGADGSQEGQSVMSSVASAEKETTSSKVAATAYSEEAADDRDESQDKTEPVELDGKWHVIRALRDGVPVSFDRAGVMTVEFDAGTIIIGSGSKEEFGKLSAEQVSMIGETSFAEVVISPIEDETGDKKEIRGFYYHEEGELTLIWGPPGAERPDPTDREDFANARILTLEAAQ